MSQSCVTTNDGSVGEVGDVDDIAVCLGDPLSNAGADDVDAAAVDNDVVENFVYVDDDVDDGGLSTQGKSGKA